MWYSIRSKATNKADINKKNIKVKGGLIIASDNLF
jgi:hypothetical protein